MGFFAGILSKKRNKKKLTPNPIIRLPTNASTSIGREEIEKAAIYSAERATGDIAKSTIQKANPPATQFNQFL